MTSVGLVLGGGGLAGFAYHTACLAVLQRLTGWDPRTAQIMVGTSAGSGVAATLRGGVGADASLDRMLSVPTNPRSMARLRELSGREQATGRLSQVGFLPVAPKLAAREALKGPFIRPVRFATALLPPGRVRTDTIGDRPAELHQGVWPADPLWITAVRLSDGELVVFGRDRADISVAAATEASSAIPAFFRPVMIDGDRYVDGGVHSCSNADLLVDEDLDLVVIVSPMSGRSLSAMSRSINGPLRMAIKHRLNKEVQQLREAGKELLILEPSLEEMRAMGATFMDPTRVLNTVLQTSSAARTALTENAVGEQLDLLRKAALEHPSPVDVEYPE